MIQLSYHHDFLKSAKQLPKKQGEKLISLIELLRDNPFHPLLHTTRLSGNLNGYLAFRITRDWRVIFQFLDPETIQLLRVVHRSTAYR
jgi:addiction module RelE/StbE family toxin